MLNLAAFQGQEMNISVGPCPFTHFLFSFVVRVLEEIVSEVDSADTSCYGLFNVEVNYNTSKIGPWVQLSNVNIQCIKLWTLGVYFFDAVP